MTVAAVREALALIREHPDEGDFVGEREEALVAAAETTLGLGFPPSYRLFVRALGAGDIGGEEVYGVISSDWEESSVPDGVWATLHARSSYGLPDTMTEIGNDGMGGLVVLDVLKADADSEPPVEVWYGNAPAGEELERLADGFGEFFLGIVRRAIAEIE